MVSNTAAIIFIVALALIAIFILLGIQNPKQRHLLNHLYMWMLLAYAAWALLMLGMWITPSNQLDILSVLDSLTYIGITIPSFYLMISIVFVRGYERLPQWCYLFLVIPLLSIFVCLTNSWHHLQYQQFSIVRSEIVFGPYVFVTGIHSYLCFLISFFLLIRFVWHNPNRLYMMHCFMLICGGLIPLIVSLAATFSNWDAPITATPIGFLGTVICNGIAIYKFNLLDITPVATQHVLDWISDCYLILSQKGLVISYNKPFASVFASRYGITENRYLKDCVREEDVSKKTAIYNMITAVNACQDAQTTISYEQASTINRDGVVQKNYYVTDVSQLIINEKSAGFVIIFKDITQLKKSMHQLQDSQSRMMEQERFAFLGQMIGGLAHNLKTPIMSISGCISAADNLVDECLSSLEDPNVNSDDYREIYGEMRDWFQKIQESTAYMSDIITAIKGQATSVSAFDESVFSLDELIKRTTLLMRHELVSSGCTLIAEYKSFQHVTLHGDINNLVQVLGNLVSNAIYSQKQAGGGC
ncbi:MAG: histidine kinase N-terminal 7TM domain-containing protein, partial [Lawsonibacter sp.]|nr:histidine kinase N-terminal 7TM domain-containing protein [Lawsonibacter sp.]